MLKTLKILWSCTGLLLKIDNPDIAADQRVQQTGKPYLQSATSIPGKLSVRSALKSTVIMARLTRGHILLAYQKYYQLRCVLGTHT